MGLTNHLRFVGHSRSIVGLEMRTVGNDGMGLSPDSFSHANLLIFDPSCDGERISTCLQKGRGGKGDGW